MVIKFRHLLAAVLVCVMLLSALASCTAAVVPTQKASGKETSEPSTEETTVSETVPASETIEPETEQSTTPEPETSEPETPSVVLPADPVETLKDLRVLFCGDSICMASTHDKAHQWWGWAGRINQDYALKSYVNAGVDGASVSNCRGENTIYNQINRNRSFKADIVVLHGGVNDAWDSTAVGAMIDKSAEETLPRDCDLTTFAGGLENLIYFTKKTFPDAVICYVINFPLNSSQGSLRDMSEYVSATIEICDKWGVPYLDLYHDELFDRQFRHDTARCLADGIHPNSKGYDLLAPKIAQFMADVYAVSGKASAN